MKNNVLLFLSIIILFTSSCDDDYIYHNEDPNWLGSNIYDYLNENGNYTYFVRLIEDCGRKDELQRTGSNTLFVCDDDAFERFFKNENEWNVENYESLTSSQKNQILRYALLKNASVIEVLSSGQGPVKGQNLRLSTYLEPLDLLVHEAGNDLPQSSFFNSYQNDGLYLLKDNSSPMLVLFSDAYMEKNSVYDSDFSFIMNGNTRKRGDAHFFDVKVKDDGKDITCKNGYIHILEELMIPRQNMADYIKQNQEMTTFNMLMEQFCAPYYDASSTNEYKILNPEFKDSIFVKRFFNSGANSLNRTPDGTVVPSTELLLFDPGVNAYSAPNTSANVDMAAMFVPTDQALEEYFYNGSGKFLQERYGNWENVPKNITSLFINSHMKYSMLESLPSRFGGIKNESGHEMHVDASLIKNAYISSNGLIYLTSKVYPPVDYSSVLAPILVNENTKVWNWGVTNCQLDLYLNSMESKYSFLIPTDDYLKDYRCPVYWGHSIKENWKFWFNTTLDQVVATRYNFETGDSIGIVTNPTILKNRLLDMLDYHIVVGDIESGNRYYITKGGGFIEVENTGTELNLWGGGNRELNKLFNTDEYTVQIDQKNGIYSMENGKSYFITRQLQQPVTSLYSTLQNNPEFSKFFELLQGSDSIFFQDASYPGYDLTIRAFSAFHYTVYVPTNAAIDNAIAAGLPTWEEIAMEGDIEIKQAKKQKLDNFLKYHFQDNSSFIGGAPVSAQPYATAASYPVPGTAKYKFYNLNVTCNDTNLSVVDEAGRTVNVIKNNGLYNLMVRDYGFGVSTKGDVSTSTSIEFSSRIVIHQIDNYLLYSQTQLQE